MQFYGVKEDG